MKFWDASAIIPLCLQERDSPSLKKLIRTDQSIIAWWASPIECLSALARLRREKALSIDEEGQAQVCATGSDGQLDGGGAERGCSRTSGSRSTLASFTSRRFLATGSRNGLVSRRSIAPRICMSGSSIARCRTSRRVRHLAASVIPIIKRYRKGRVR